jgi:two-component system, chemotaxis family, sensor kinase CheA
LTGSGFLKLRAIFSDKPGERRWARCVARGEERRMDELIREFVIESQEGLDRMERCLTDLESRPDDAELLAEIFRTVHTIKGATGFLGFKGLETLAHTGENLLGMMRDGTVAAESHVITVLLDLLDGLRSILKRIEEEGGESCDGKELQDAELIRRLTALQAASAEGAAGGEREKCAAPLAKPESGRSQNERVTNKAGAHGTLPDDARAQGHGEGAEFARVAATPPPSSAAESTLRVDVKLLNRLMNLVGELVLTRNQVLQATAADQRMTMLSRRLDMVTADLREGVMRARMQPVSNIFSKVPRMVRDLSHTLGRSVRLEMEGQETELDKSLLEAIKDPLTHAVRNALDHGIEAPAARVAQGKPEEGVLRLRAAQEGSHVVVEISDDGAGIAVESVRARAVERGLVAPERAAEMSKRELLQLIFLPGFSTARQVTNVSGRGVGMDVVRTNVEKIGGKVELDSQPGRGTTVRMRIPLTLAIIPALIVRSLGQSFALPQSALSELVHVSGEEAKRVIEWMGDAPVYRLRGHLLPLVILDRLLGAAADDVGGREHFIAVLDADGRKYGLVVDGLADPEEIVVKPLSPLLKSVGLYSGATVLGSAELALILDPGAMATRAGITISERDNPGNRSDTDGEEASELEHLVVSVGERQAAVPLKEVLRIEQVPAARMEYVGRKPVLNFGGRLLRVEDPGDRLHSAASDASLLVVVCSDDTRHVGIVVDQVLDVAKGSELMEAGSESAIPGLRLLCERITSVFDLDLLSGRDPTRCKEGFAQQAAEERDGTNEPAMATSWRDAG